MSCTALKVAAPCVAVKLYRDTVIEGHGDREIIPHLNDHLHKCSALTSRSFQVVLMLIQVIEESAAYLVADMLQCRTRYLPTIAGPLLMSHI